MNKVTWKSAPLCALTLIPLLILLNECLKFMMASSVRLLETQMSADVAYHLCAVSLLYILYRATRRGKQFIQDVIGWGVKI